jgi:hypothetical protein
MLLRSLMAHGMHIAAGDRVTLRAYGSQVIERICVSVTSSNVYVCLEEEYLAALAEDRAPGCIGFRFSDIIQVKAQCIDS